MTLKSNDAENVALITGINYILKIYSNRNQLFEIVKIYIFLILFYCTLDQINEGLVSISDSFKKTLKNI